MHPNLVVSVGTSYSSISRGYANRSTDNSRTESATQSGAVRPCTSSLGQYQETRHLHQCFSTLTYLRYMLCTPVPSYAGRLTEDCRTGNTMDFERFSPA